ncbi:MAG: phage tail protein [Prevotella sp.]|nr:phage tail protein [Prevotella sp.]
MKKILLLVSLFTCTALAHGQGYIWQGIVRDAAGKPLANQTVELKVTVMVELPSWAGEGVGSLADLSSKASLAAEQLRATGEGSDSWTVLIDDSYTVETDEQGFAVFDILEDGTQALKQVKQQLLYLIAATYPEPHFRHIISLKQPDETYLTLEDEEQPYIPFADYTVVQPEPVGAIAVWCGPTGNIPSGWLLCDGASVSRSDYSELFAAIGTAWGTASSTTFNLPDMRGVFLRGVDGTAGRDPNKSSRTAKATGGNTGNKVGSYQADEFKSHTHTYSFPKCYPVVIALNGSVSVYTSLTTSYTSNPAFSTVTETAPNYTVVYYIVRAKSL